MTSAAQSPSAAAERFLRELLKAFEHAALDAGGAIDHDLEIASHRVRLSFAGPTLERELAPPLAHLAATSPGKPEAILNAWDTASTGVALPTPPFGPLEVRYRGEVEGWNDERFGAVYDWELENPHAGRQALSMYDAAEGSGVYWVPDLGRMPWWEVGAPFRPLLHWALSRFGGRLAHAAAVGTEGIGVLLAGPGGSGKSSTALACLESGLDFAGDDYVLVTADPEPVAHSVYCTAKVDERGLEMLPGLVRGTGDLRMTAGGKFLVNVLQHRPRQLARGLELRALVVPRIKIGGSTRLVPMSRARGLLALAPTTVYQLPGNAAALESLADIARSLPVYSLEIGGPPAEAAQAIGDLLGSLT
jgi:hypothetical protein